MLVPNEQEGSAEPEQNEEESEESDASTEPTIADLVAELAELKKQLATPKEDNEESESKEKDKSKPKVDALHVDYAEYLKSQMGKNYPKEFDKLPLEVRIPAMKATLNATKSIKPPVKEGTVPKGTPINTFIPSGTNYKEIAKKIRGQT
jgi:hypothetical protein